ncbi:MAG: TetR/AcrR family transcriptional regulator [Archangium sp.]
MFNETRKVRILQREATAQAVLEAARAEFERVGFEGANIRSIAARAKVSAGTVLHHYADKSELLHAALFDELDRTLRDALAGQSVGKLEGRLDRLARRVFRSYQRRPALSRTLLKESLFAGPAWAAKFGAQTTAVHQAITLWVADAVKAGELRRGVDGPLVAMAWLSFFYFALIAWAQGQHPKPVGLVERLTAQHLDGLRRKS